MRWLRIAYKVVRTLFFELDYFLCWNVTIIKFVLNGVHFRWDFTAKGIPVINVNLNGHFSIGRNFVFHSGKYHNMIGRQQTCYFLVGADAELLIGDNVGVSSTAIVCHKLVKIGNNVKIGGNSVIYDTDFHSLDHAKRNAIPEDISTVQCRPVIIEDGVFIGAHTTILKGVTIGTNAVIGSGSVITKSIPANEVWAGNPARFVKQLKPQVQLAHG